MKKLGEHIKQIRKKVGLTQKDLAKKLGVYQADLHRWETGNVLPGAKHLMKLGEVLNISIDWLLYGETRKKEVPSIVAESRKKYEVKSETKKLIAVPVINEVPAGYPAYPDIDDYVRTYIYLPDVPKKSFGLFVNGESMEPEICDGDIVILNPTIEHIKKGDLGVFRINGDVSLKRYLPIKNGIFLQPVNPEFTPIFVSSDDECELIGKVIYKILKCK